MSSNDIEPWRPSELERWMDARRRNQFIGRWIASGVVVFGMATISLVMVTDHWHHIGAIIDGVSFTVLGGVILLALIWLPHEFEVF